jgi:photosystem II stability/assembly factor-like uncharacterized protein
MKRRVWLLALALISCGALDAQWQMENSGTTADLRGIDNVGGGVAWASGTNGTVLRTEDGGYMWQPCSVPPGAEKLDFRGIQAFDANTAIVMSSGTGDLSRLYKTTDGCQTWKLIFTNPDKDGFWDAVYLDRHKRGWLLGDPVKGSFSLFASEDAGRTWVRQRNKGLAVDTQQQGAFAASNSSLWASSGSASFASGGTGGAFVYRLVQVQVCVDDCSEPDLNREGRKNKWEREPIPVGSRTEASGVFSLAENQVMIAVGGDYRKPDDSTATAAYTKDGGNSWSHAATMPNGYRSAVAYDEGTKTWITVGPNGTDVSTDDGKNWRAVHPDAALHEAADADENWNALSLPFVVGPKGRIGKLDRSSF